jgi:hypothetical protein
MDDSCLTADPRTPPAPQGRRGTTLRAAVVAVAAWVLMPWAMAADEPPSARDIRDGIDAAARLFEAGKSQEALAPLAEAARGLETLAALPRLPAGYRALADRAGSVRRKLERAGIDVATIVIPSGTVKPPVAAPVAPAPAPRPAAGAVKTGVSFSTQVAPILVNSCGGCHVAGQRGNFQMASYEGLMRSGMVQRGAGNSSRLVEVILTGDMPRGGGKVSAADVATLVKWIDAGATCDSDPTIGLDVLARRGAALAAAPPEPAGPAAKPMPLRAGDVSFATGVAPLLIAQCLDCHGERNPEANLRMATLDGLLRGGRSGAAVIPGRGAESLLVKKLRGIGIEGQRMPLNRDPLSDAQIAMVEKWVDQGAKLDLLTGKEPLETLAAAGRARSLSNGELAAIRAAAGAKLWKRAIPDEEPAVCSRDGVCLIGSLPEVRLEALAGEAVDVEARVRKELAVGAGPLIRGGIVLYPFERSFDYSAVWQTLVGVERPKGIFGHAATSADVVYGALLLPAADADESGDAVRLLLAEQIAAAAFSGRGAPDWFCRGSGRALALRVAPRADAAKEWRRDLGGAVKQVGSAQDFLTARADPAAAALAAGGFLGAIGTPARLAQMVKALDGGETFDDAFVRVFKAEPRQAYDTWAARQGR